MSEEKRQMIASMGGKKAHALGKAHRFTSEEARKAGKIGAPRSRNTKPVYDMTSLSIRSQLLALLQDSITHRPGKPVSFVALGKELGISREYIRVLYHQLKHNYIGATRCKRTTYG
jgi:hypothetical protein